MADNLHLKVITPLALVIDEQVELVEGPGELGEFGILPGHVPFLTTLSPGFLKFKQGFGRLIRTKTDKGAVLVLDRRLISKFYGKYFLNSLPDCTRLVDSSENIINNLKLFIG